MLTYNKLTSMPVYLCLNVSHTHFDLGLALVVSSSIYTDTQPTDDTRVGQIYDLMGAIPSEVTTCCTSSCLFLLINTNHNV